MHRTGALQKEGTTYMPKRVAARESAQATVSDAAAAVQPAWQSSHTDGSRGVLVRVPSETWQSLKAVARDQSRTLQSVMAEAVDDYLRKHGKA
jgi:hypothetical protein